MSKTVKAGRSFEQLIESIKHLRLPNALIKSPERLRDVDTNTTREVDVGIHVPEEKGEIFIAVECRDRGDIEDITWVEQLIAKKRSIQANLIIAVTSSDFTRPAARKASVHGIQLRRVRDFQPEEILEWAEATYVTIAYICLDAITDAALCCEGTETIRENLDRYRYLLDGMDTGIPFEEFLSLIWTDDVLLETGHKIPNHGDSVRFHVRLDAAKDMYVEGSSRMKIQSVLLEGVAIRFIQRYPATRIFSYEDRIQTKDLAEGYRYRIQGSEAVQLLVESETKNATLEIDWKQLKHLDHCMRDVITDVVLAYREPVILKSYRFK